ncbi:MAG: hypothetical protein MUC50_09175 [Myxococcota bacterium]|jgi:hypothetical protein|nr:hypothetical protein [Myxococcota bacterium]
MGIWMSSFSLIDRVFLGSAVVGGTLFLARMIMVLLGLGADGDGVGGTALPVDHDVDTGHQTDLSFKLLSFQALMAFFMMFGLAGLAMSQGSKFAALISLPVAAGAGVASVWVLRWLFSFFSKMQSSGTMDLKAAMGQRGRVYLTIPDSGMGKLELVVQGRMRVMSAVSLDGKAIPTDAQAEVVEIQSGDILVVRRY